MSQTAKDIFHKIDMNYNHLMKEDIYDPAQKQNISLGTMYNLIQQEGTVQSAKILLDMFKTVDIQKRRTL